VNPDENVGTRCPEVKWIPAECHDREFTSHASHASDALDAILSWRWWLLFPWVVQGENFSFIL